MTHVFSTINLKGGVGKTTTTVALAETFSAAYGKRVLVIDLDPQTNATTMLIGEERWEELNAQRRTLVSLFDRSRGLFQPEFNFNAVVQGSASDVLKATTVDLLPSSPDLMAVSETGDRGEFGLLNPYKVLSDAVAPHLGDYDIVIIDCPPNLGAMTLNGVFMSQAFLIPTIPDVLSTYGIPQVVKQVRRFADAIGRPIVPLGILVSKFREQSTTHLNGLRRLREESRAKTGLDVFEAIIPERDALSSAPEYLVGGRTLRQKYKDSTERFHHLGAEILARLDATPSRHAA